MKIKSFIILIYVIAGLVIVTVSSYMTYIIIGAPVKMPMIKKIIYTILITLPIIGAISYFLANLLANKFSIIQNRLKDLKKENFTIVEDKNIISEINYINQDINDLSGKLNHLITDLKEKNSNLSTLLVSMSHDIKTPITILNGYIDEIGDGMVKNENLPIVLRSMKNEVNFLNELTVDMVDYISSMKNERKKVEINLHTFIQNEIFILLPNEKNVKYINDIPKDFTLEFNKIDLKKSFLNLLFNSIKHTNTGYIKIHTHNNKILIENTGAQISKEYHEKIFEPFFVVDKSKNRENNGFGLGLSIVKNLCKNNSYDCLLYSSDENKTIFCICV